ncbi:hypothetical protein BGZ88_011713 [Linnemannia elongata]|nr:hypothetical protein BGZ88_011713 [Linnemannia elongata]
MDIHVQHSRNMPELNNDHNGEHRHQQQLFGCGQESKSVTGSGSGSAAWTTMTRSKALKSLALLEAQAAVKFDNEGLVLDALEAYGKAVTLLEMVMKSTTSPEEYERLLAIVISEPGILTPESVNTSTVNNINYNINIISINNTDNSYHGIYRSLQPV